MLAEADIATTVFITERPHHAHEKVRDEDLSQWDTLVVMAGDGLLYEVVNGLMERPDWEDTMKKPLCILPGGSGNALAASINHYAGNDHVAKKKLLTNCTFILCKGLHTQMDLVSLSTASGKRLFSFLGFGWGFISDVDIDSEKYRRLGNARFTLGTLQCLAKLRVYQGRLSSLPAHQPQPERRRELRVQRALPCLRLKAPLRSPDGGLPRCQTSCLLARAIHPRTSAWRAPQAQVFAHSQALLPPEHREQDTLPKSWQRTVTREGLCTASPWLRSVPGAAGDSGRREPGGGNAGADPGVSRSRKHRASGPRFACWSPFRNEKARSWLGLGEGNAATSSKSKGEFCASWKDQRTLPDRPCSTWTLSGCFSNA
ncbi:PREDICTED: sphingosine kinase 1 [Nipponia nippon]|uniref:sphingosine kinase 1 n=1 Tax=Nipponia nippon TaxID=128390 RepID=UPI00051179FE|nr:PREDICTED: sphingosine kinase 1 [Nipponia nippon]